MSAPVLSWLLIVAQTITYRSKQPVNGKFKGQSRSPLFTLRRQVASAPSKRLNRRSTLPALRASPFPEVTDLFCRLPLPTLLYRPEADHLGDLMRLWVRSKVRINLSLGFSRIVESAPDTFEKKMLFRRFNPISS